jgi:hypothetical protein
MRRLAVLASLLLVTVLSGVAGASPPTGSPRWALLVGIDHFEGATRPNSGAVGDAEAMRDLLLQSGWPADHIRVLTDGAATAADVREGLRWLADNSSDTSFSVFSYSGHVKQEGTTEYLWPHDNRFIADTELADNLRQVKGWEWVQIAGCEAAGFDEGIAGPQRLVTASSQESEKSYELPPEIGRSVFGNLMVDNGLAQAKAAGTPMSIQEAFRRAADQAPGFTAGQSQGAQNPYIAGGDGQDWFLSGTTAPAPPPPPPKHCVLFFCLP